MKKIDEKTAMSWSKTSGYKSKLNYSKRVIESILESNAKPYIASSFGKDSAAMMWLVFSFDKSIPVYFVEYPETKLMDNYEDVIKQWGDIDLKSVFLDVGILDEANEKDIIPSVAKSHGLDTGFVGIRKEESKGRRISINKHGVVFKAKNGITRVCPLANWSAIDSAACCVSNDLPLLSSYKKFGFQERTVSGMPNDEWGFRQAALKTLKQRDISSFNYLLSIYPELNIYT